MNDYMEKKLLWLNNYNLICNHSIKITFRLLFLRLCSYCGSNIFFSSGFLVFVFSLSLSRCAIVEACMPQFLSATQTSKQARDRKTHSETEKQINCIKYNLKYNLVIIFNFPSQTAIICNRNKNIAQLCIRNLAHTTHWTQVVESPFCIVLLCYFAIKITMRNKFSIWFIRLGRRISRWQNTRILSRSIQSAIEAQMICC